MQNELFKKQYRIPSTRLVEYDYSQPGFYFITICTKNRIDYFGKIVDCKMVLNDVGIIAQKCWLEIPQHFLYVKLDEFTIMPNHIHGIIQILESNTRRDVACNVSTNNVINNPMSKISPKPSSLSAIIRSYKSAVTRIINEKINNNYFAWQPRFYDHIIRTEKSFNGIRWYIYTNPERWYRDRNNPDGILI